MNKHVADIAPQLPKVAVEQPAELRRAIDRVSMLRARNIRVGFYSTALNRPHPERSTTPEESQLYLSILQSEVAEMRAVCDMLSKGTSLPDIPPEITQWIHQFTISEPAKLQRVMDVMQLSERVLSATLNKAQHMAAAIDAHVTVSRDGFFELITALCEGLWSHHAKHREAELEQASACAKILAVRLSRLERIGKHVKLVSLNASVEAARAGDVGKGLMVIAQEFKALAEEIQTLAKDASADIDDLSRS